MWRGALPGAAAVWLAAAPLAAQASLRLSAVRTSYPGIPAATAWQLAPRADWSNGRVRTSIETNAAMLDDDSWAVSGAADVAWRVAGRGDNEAALVFAASGHALEDGFRSGLALAGVATASRLGPAVVGLSLVGGVINDVTDTTSATWRAGISAGTRAGGFAFALRGASTRVRETDFATIELELARQVGPLALSAAGGVWEVTSGPVLGLWRAQAVWQLARSAAVDVSAGRNPRSPQGFSEGSFATAGLRLIAAGRPVRPPVVEPAGPGRIRVTFVQEGRDVAIAGEWNSWTPVAMTREADGRWSVVIAAGPGAHKFMLVVDGRNVVPRGVLKLPDGFGGEVGLLVL